MLRADSGSSVDAHEPEFEKAPTPPGLLQEHYRYPHLYRMPDPGQRYADIQLRRELSFSRWIEGSGDVARFLPGFVFSVSRYPRPEINNEHWGVTSVLHQGEQPQVLQREAPDRGVQYHPSFLAIPDTARFAFFRFYDPEALDCYAMSMDEPERERLLGPLTAMLWPTLEIDDQGVEAWMWNEVFRPPDRAPYVAPQGEPAPIRLTEAQLGAFERYKEERMANWLLKHKFRLLTP